MSNSSYAHYLCASNQAYKDGVAVYWYHVLGAPPVMDDVLWTIERSIPGAATTVAGTRLPISLYGNLPNVGGWLTPAAYQW